VVTLWLVLVEVVVVVVELVMVVTDVVVEVTVCGVFGPKVVVVLAGPTRQMAPRGTAQSGRVTRNRAYPKMLDRK